MQFSISSNTNFSGISVDKSYPYSFERKTVINSIKSKLLRGKVTDSRGYDLYQKYDRKGYNFFLTHGWNNSIDVYIDKVKTDKSGKNNYKHKYCVGSFNTQNVDTFTEAVRNLKKDENSILINTMIHLIGITFVFGLTVLLGLYLKK